MQLEISKSPLPKLEEVLFIPIEELRRRYIEERRKRLLSIENLRILSINIPESFKSACRAVAVSLLLPFEIKENKLFAMTSSQVHTSIELSNSCTFQSSKIKSVPPRIGEGKRPLYLVIFHSFLMSRT
ncbi:MAG: hypothetical protein EZS28_051354, partial [Streblomastix strix]